MRIIYSEYVKNKSTLQIANFVESQLDEFQNPKMEKILRLTGLFSREWESNLKKDTEGELKDSVDSIVSNRNNIAHGQDVAITYVRIKTYYQNALKVVDLIENQCNPE